MCSSDLNGTDVDPCYLSDSILEPTHVVLNNSATTISSIAYDIDSTIRNISPDRGAKEFNLCYDDAGLDGFIELSTPVSEGLQPIRVLLRNHGNNTLTSVHISWSVNGIPQPEYIWNGSLMTSTIDTVTIGNFQFQGGTLYEVIAKIGRAHV